MTKFSTLKIGIALSLMAGLAVASSREARHDSLDTVLREEAPRIMNYIRVHGYQTVGVLKFAIKKGDKAASLNAGPLNTKMATSVENALILLNDRNKPINIVHDASRSAAGQSRGATFRNAQGRRGLFEHTYPLAWDSEKKQPDAFLTGELLVDKNMKKLTIVVRAFEKKKPETLNEVLRIDDVPVDRNVLAGIGQSFVVSRRLLHRGSDQLDEAAAEDASSRDKSSDNPTEDSDDPVKLEIFYDDKPVSLESDPASPGELRVKRAKTVDPKEGQKVKFKITNVTKETIGVVLAVDGKSTLFAEDLTTKSPGDCTKWILAAGEVYTIGGFYMGEDGKDVRGFKVLSDDESAKVELAPEQKGVFSMFAFREGASGAMNVSTEGGDLSRSPKRQPGKRSLADVQASLQTANHTRALNGRLVAERVGHRAHTTRHATQKGGRGLIVQDTQSTAGGNLNRVAAKLDPQPAMSLSIRYYTGPTPVAQ